MFIQVSTASFYKSNIQRSDGKATKSKFEIQETLKSESQNKKMDLTNL